MDPRLVDLDELELVGLPYYGDPSNESFSRAWHRLMQADLPAQVRENEKIWYGVEVYGPEFHQDHLWTYFPCYQVHDLGEIPGTLFAKRLPATRYAVFRVSGGLAKISEMFQYAYGQWLPNSGYEVAYPFDFERYGEEFRGDTPDSVVEIYVPIRAKAGV